MDSSSLHCLTSMPAAIASSRSSGAQRIRDHPLRVPQDRCAHRRAQDPHQDGAAISLSARSSLDRARHLKSPTRRESMRQVPLSPSASTTKRVANVPQHPPPSTRLMPCACIAKRLLPRIIGASSIRRDWRLDCNDLAMVTSVRYLLYPWTVQGEGRTRKGCFLSRSPSQHRPHLVQLLLGRTAANSCGERPLLFR
jgi:hypothetical protein